MRRHSRKHTESIFKFAGREITAVNLKIIFDNVRNYGLGALALTGAKNAIALGDTTSLFAAPALLVSILLIAANVAQTYLIAYRYFEELQRNKLDGSNDALPLGYKLWCGLLSLTAGGSFVYVIFKAIPL